MFERGLNSFENSDCLLFGASRQYKETVGRDSDTERCDFD